ncbi:phosphate/phosphite/phosphonate ABC transporter substrate-binding protein [Marinobacterium rhizophilum]|uniref:Phosphate/phosphite/phosphonate ABC transporter substrate-binding protein n=1 Tax=Marinobacterium rhizophilum TaxID=420402 RepID=A0ABY5HFS9_9GAMM|nr:phosphate/phosphite/phosphonate ABC transporter substrate-binding protein [Marinobacterium rhizophilum]UTW10672.1 phosphate/phosphite/phosphonate ABC transporter substrate-binding protein [Marinobacterium rhizophilum]
MKNKMLSRIIPLLLGLLLSLPAQSRVLVLGQVSERPDKDYEQLRPMVEHAAAQLSSLGVSGGDVRLYLESGELVAAMRRGEVDWVTETAYTAARLVHEAGARPLLRKWKRGQRDYQGIIYTRADSPVHGLNDLAGQTIAFEDADSFSSYYLPRMLLEQQGLQLRPMESLQQSAEPGLVSYIFSRTEENNALWVHKSLSAAGALNNNDWDNPTRVPPGLRSDLRIIYRSASYPRALELVSAGLEPALATALRHLLLSMTPETSAELLARYEQTTGFEPILPDDMQLLNDIYESSRTW